MKFQQALNVFVTKQMTRMRRDRTRVAAVRSAYTVITYRHRMWVESGFDMYFLQSTAAPLLEPFYQGGEGPNPLALAQAWCDLYRFTGGRQQQAIENILPVMNEFVHVLKDELAFRQTPKEKSVSKPLPNYAR